MYWFRAKTILIVILLALHAVLIGILVYRQWQESAAERELHRLTVEVLENAGYQLSGAEFSDADAAVIYVERDISAERAVASALFSGEPEIRPLSASDRTSSQYIFEDGSISFRPAGQFEIALAEPFPEEEITQRFGRWLREIGFHTGDGEPLPEPFAGGMTIHARREGLRVWDERIDFAVVDGLVVSVQGRWLLGRAAESETEQSQSPEQVLLSLSDFLRAEGKIPGEISSVELGFRPETLPGISRSITRFVPHWRVSVSAGDYYVNALTGACEQIFEGGR